MENQSIWQDAYQIIDNSVKAVLPGSAVRTALQGRPFSQGVYVVAVGKAAWEMSKTAKEILGGAIVKGIVLTKYGHGKGNLPGFEILEAGHPIPDQNSVIATKKIVEMVLGLGEQDQVLFLLSGGGSALFELPEKGVSLADIQSVTDRLLRCGADITQINTIRKRLSAVKGGKFAHFCSPAKIFSIILSDVVGDRVDMIASGPACIDTSTYEEALQIIDQYDLKLSPAILKAVRQETPKHINNVEFYVAGSVNELCHVAACQAEKLGYHSYVLSTSLDCEAREAGRFLASIAKSIQSRSTHTFQLPCAVIAGGETTVRVQGSGLGGRNQELALSAAMGIDGLPNTVLFSFSSDGTDGPTDAAGGIVDGTTLSKLIRKNISITSVLKDNDSYHALEAVQSLVKIGATGTNVNDVSVILCKGEPI